MAKYILWIKSHKLITLLSAIILILLYAQDTPLSLKTKSSPQRNLAYPQSIGDASSGRGGGGGTESFSSKSTPIADSYNSPEAAPVPEVTERMVVSESNLSLVVKKVADTQKQIIAKAEELGGYMVTANLNNPADAATAIIVVRVPAKNFEQALDEFKSLSIKVVSENLSGFDVTDQYVDLNARLDTLNKTKAKFESILSSAIEIQDILSVQRELISLQSQIDSIKGQQQYLEKTAENAKIIVYLSTDEYALPYTPTETWRPEVIFKQAVRSLMGLIRSMGTLLIWAVVFSVVWVPALIIFKIYKQRTKKSVV